MLLNVYCTHVAPPAPTFPHVLRNRRDRSDPELGPHLNGFMGFVMQGGKRQMNQSRYHVLGHLERVRHHLALEVEPSAMPAFAEWARDANAIVFTPDGVIRAPNGAVLVDPQTGDAQAGAHVPHPPDASARKARTEQQLSALGIVVPPSLPPVASEVEVELRGLRDVAGRCMALLASARRADSINAGQPIAVAELQAAIPLGFASLSPNERAFMDNQTPGEGDTMPLVWRYEAIVPLAWSIGALSSLPFPERQCDVGALTQTMFGVMTSFTPQPRTAADVLDALDLHYRLHWATTDARVNGRRSPDGVDAGVVAERHYALNWLVRFQDAEWDDVDTPT